MGGCQNSLKFKPGEIQNLFRPNLDQPRSFIGLNDFWREHLYMMLQNQNRLFSFSSSRPTIWLHLESIYQIDSSLDQRCRIQISTAFAKTGFSLFYIRTNQYNGDCQEDPDMKLTGLNIISGLNSILFYSGCPDTPNRIYFISYLSQVQTRFIPV